MCTISSIVIAFLGLDILRAFNISEVKKVNFSLSLLERIDVFNSIKQDLEPKPDIVVPRDQKVIKNPLAHAYVMYDLYVCMICCVLQL